MLSPEFTYEHHQFAKSEPIYIHQQEQQQSFSSYKTVFSSSSSSSACSTSSSPLNNSKSLDYENEDESVGARRQGRGNRFFPDHVVDILNKWFFENQEYPYPDENMTNILAREANISAKQVRKWFANKRVRSNKCYKQTFRTRLNSTPCASVPKTRRSKFACDQDMNDESSDMDSSAHASLNQSSCHEFLYDNLIRSLQQQHQQFNLIQNAIYNSTVIANFLQSSPHLSSANSSTSNASISTSPNSSGIVKRKTHLSNCFLNDQLMNESPIKSDRSDTDDSVFKQDQSFYLHQFQLQFQQLIQQQQHQQKQHQQQQQQQQQQEFEQAKKPKVNFGLVSDLI